MSSLEIQRVLDACVERGAPGAIVAIGQPGGGVSLSASSGRFERNNPRALTPADSFRIASVTKTATAAATVRLASEGRWNLDDPVVPYLPRETAELIRGFEALDEPDDLTLRRLLSHRSGLPDYFFDPTFQERVRSDPARAWRPIELLRAAAEIGTLDFAPGSSFAYGDTGFVVVGLAIEEMTGQSLGDAYRSLLFDPLGMDATYLEWHEAARGGEISHHYDGDLDLIPWNTSFDWGGGGLVSTASDLVQFLHGIFEHRLFGEPWLAEMTAWRDDVHWRPDSSARYRRYGLGIGANVASGEEILGSTGVWGAFAYYWPAGRRAIAGTVNLRGFDREALLAAIVDSLRSG